MLLTSSTIHGFPYLVFIDIVEMSDQSYLSLKKHKLYCWNKILNLDRIDELMLGL